MTRSMSILWVTDPWETLDHPRDTTLRLAEEAVSRGVSCHWCDVRSIRLEGSSVRLSARAIEGIYPGRLERSFSLGPAAPRAPAEFDSIHYRVDPPVDHAYLHPLQLLALAGREARIVNPAEALCVANEKLEAAFLGDLMPPGIVATLASALEAFGEREGRAVLKPLHQAQSKGVELLSWKSAEEASAARAKLAEASDGFTRPVLLQRYLEGIAQGEQRLWFVDGKLLSWCRKLPLSGDFRVNLDQGSRIARSELSKAEKKAATRIGRRLRERRIRLAAVDLIEGLVTDFNFTSPGLIPQMEALLGENLAGPIVEALARR